MNLGDSVFNKHDIKRNQFMLTGPFKRKGYDWWWHSFTAINKKTGIEKPFYIEFFICNPSLASDNPTFGQLKENKEKGIKPSYLMVNVGCWGEDSCQLHRFFSLKDIKINKKAPYSILADDCYLSETETRGKVLVKDSINHPEWMCNDGLIEWDLKIDKKIAFNVGYGASTFFRFIKAFEMYWHAEGMKTLYSGSIFYNNEEYIVTKEGSYGYADKNWGRGFTSPWVWLSSNNLYSKLQNKKLTNSVFDIGGGRPKIYFIPLNRKLLGAFYYEGEELEFNFSKFWTKPKTIFSEEETNELVIWHVTQSNRKYKIETNFNCKKKDMILINYESPDGMKRHNHLNNGGNGTGNIKLYKKEKKNWVLIDDIDVSNLGCEYGEYDK